MALEAVEVDLALAEDGGARRACRRRARRSSPAPEARRGGRPRQLPVGHGRGRRRPGSAARGARRGSRAKSRRSARAGVECPTRRRPGSASHRPVAAPQLRTAGYGIVSDALTGGRAGTRSEEAGPRRPRRLLDLPVEELDLPQPAHRIHVTVLGAVDGLLEDAFHQSVHVRDDAEPSHARPSQPPHTPSPLVRFLSVGSRPCMLGVAGLPHY